MYFILEANYVVELPIEENFDTYFVHSFRRLLDVSLFVRKDAERGW